MNLLQKAISWVRSLSLTDTVGWQDTRHGNFAGVEVSQESVLALSATWACVNLISGTISSLPLMVYRNRNGVRLPAYDHPLYYVLHDSPNRDQTAIDFWDFCCASLELRGNAYAKIDRIGGRIVALTPVRPDYVTVDRTNDGVLRYRWNDAGKSMAATPDTMFHLRGFGGSALGGLSTLAYGRNTFGLAQAIEQSASGTFGNGMRPAGVLTFKDFLSPENRAIAETRLTEKFVGANNAGRPMVLEGGTTWTQLSITPEDSQLLESRGMSVEEICRFFGVPPIMVGHGEKTSSWGTGVQEVTLGFVKYTLRRRLKRIEQAIGKQLLTAADRAAGVTVEFNIEGLLRGDSKARAEFYASGLQNGWTTINEVRALENLPPVDGGDTPRMQMQNVPITEAGQQPGVAA